MRLLSLLAVLAFVPPLSAQNGVPSPQGWSVSLHGGGAAFSDFQRTTIVASGQDRSGGFESRAVPRRLGAKTSASVAAAVSYWPTRDWGIRVFGSYSPSRFRTVIPEADAEFMNVSRDAEESGALAPLTIVSYDVQAMFRLPTIRQRIMPYGLVGGGAIRYVASRQDRLPAEAAEDFASGSQTAPAVRLGVGALLPMRRSGWGLTFELHDQISKSPIPSGGDRSVSVTNALGFMVGMRFAF